MVIVKEGAADREILEIPAHIIGDARGDMRKIRGRRIAADKKNPRANQV